ncbi:hypothetical protein FJQ54_16395 [Sandaracinobacter neustonicus]|uniref:Uncharacterized protein n=1 Tax=Sandaracinobacter neustonicus TaxID=1715348 RepID=A0A501XDM1_9SPHN|nr:hypothetical protein [Sandaracinobacter neustonicus]TPE58632.1 hypothetical protein FJQ54_16395 [Sandaracinobacter neustonicus]
MPNQKDISVNKKGGSILPGVAAAAAAAAAALAAWQLVRRQLKRSPIVVAEQGGPYRLLQPKNRPVPGANPFTIVASLPRPHASLPQWTLERILIAPYSRRFAVEERELVAGEIYETDWAVSLIDMNGAMLFFATDDSYPTTLYSGTDPDGPIPLQQAQARADAEWNKERVHTPGLPRTILSGRFADVSSAGTFRVAGWLANGNLVVAGRTPVRVAFPDGSPYDSDDIGDWWGIVAPSGSGWAYVEKGAGPVPPRHSLVTMPAKSLNVSLSPDGLLLLNRRPVPGYAPMAAVDGPYPPRLG